jgi:hypothetical protein
MDAFGTPTPPVGDIIIIRERLHGTAINTLVTPYADPEEWFFKQFPSEEAAREWALRNNITFKENKSSDNQPDNES